MLVNKLISFADLHGDFDALVYLLTYVIKVATFENQVWKWTAKNTTLVCLGDFLDRYRIKNEYDVSTRDAIAGEVNIIACFRSLQEQAKLQDCEFIVLLGNHELGNILQIPDLFPYQMKHPESELERKMRVQF